MHRVKVYEGIVGTADIINLTPMHQCRLAYLEFEGTAECKWIENNAISILYEQDDVSVPFKRRILFLADLTDKQYVDFLLRFDHAAHVYAGSS